jgi:hypothetical protein
MNVATSVYSETDPVVRLDEALWSATQQSRVLQELRRDISIVWEDQAARDINGRYLNPHETDDLSMREGISEQAERLKQAKDRCEVAKNLGQQAEEFSLTIAERTKFARQDLVNAYSSFDVFVQYNADARSKFPTIQRLIDNANSAC